MKSSALADLWPLSPLQEGLLFHALYDAEGPDVYTVQLALTWEGRWTRLGCGRRGRRCWTGTPTCG